MNSITKRSKRFADNCSPEELQSLMPSDTNMDSNDSHGYPNNTQPFNVILLASHVVGILIIVLTILWTNKSLGGFDWSKPATEFNFHPLFLIIGMIYLYGNSIITYRIFRSLDKSKLKLIHTVLHAACLVFTATGLFAVIDFHNRANIVNFYSLHSWVGIGAVSIYFLQWIGSFYAFLYPGIKPSYRALALPFHVRGGLILFAISVAACLTGLTEKIFFSIGKENYPKLPSAAYYANFIGIFIVLYAIIVGYMVTETSFARKPLPTEGKSSTIGLSEGRPQ